MNRRNSLSLAWFVNAATLIAQVAPSLSGVRTATGIRINSDDPGCRFVMDLEGKEIQPISSTRLLWRIDGREIGLSIVPRPWHLRESAPDPDILRAWREESAGAGEEFECQPGRTCLLWSQPGKEQTLWTAAAVNGNRIIILNAASRSRADEEAIRAWLKKTLLSLRRGEAVPAPSADPPKGEFGTPLQDQFRYNQASTGQPHGAFLNRKLMTAQDAGVKGTVPVSPQALVEIAKFLLCAGPFKKRVQVSVFDGTLAHAVTLYDFDSATGLFKYRDPRGQGSFLAAGSNQAGIAAVPDASDKGAWLVKASDLERVYYSTVLPQREIIALLRLITLLDGPEPTLINTYRVLQQEDSQNPEVSALRFVSIGAWLFEKKQYDAALKTARVWLALYPEEAGPQKHVLASAFDAAGRTDLAQELDRPFVPEKGAAPAKWTLMAAVKTGFFRAYHLTQSAEEEAVGGGRLVRFRPTGEKFRELVEVTATEEPAGDVSRWALRLAQSMVAEPSNFVFAADIARSFLKFTVPDSGNEAVGRFAREISVPPDSSDREVQVPGAPAGVTVPPVRSFANVAFRGGRDSYEVALDGGGLLRLETLRPPDPAGVKISVVIPARR